MIAVTLVGLCDSVGADPNAAAQSAFVAGGDRVFNDPRGLSPAGLGVKAVHGWQHCPEDALSRPAVESCGTSWSGYSLFCTCRRCRTS